MADLDLLVVGELNVDLILAGDVTPAFGQVERLLDDATLTVGSSSAIFACGAARLGLRVAFAGTVGDDVLGHYMLRELAARGVDTTAVVVNPTLKTGLTVILMRGTDRAMLTYPGSIAALRSDEIDPRLLARARHLHLGSYYLLDALRPDIPRLFATAHTHGLTVSLDPNYDPSEQWDGGIHAALRHVDIFLPNETELCAIAGRADHEGALAELAAEASLVAVKRGANGATARRGAETVSTTSPPVTAVETTGAGDSFDAGFVYGFLAGWGLERSLRLACACGALSTRAAGGVTAQATLEEAIAASQAVKPM
jgi:sugar/nucleoside kinase (ribokinase family)